MESGSQDHNLPASQQKLNKARADGQVVRSRDLSNLAVLGSGALALALLLPSAFEKLQLSLRQHLSFQASSLIQAQDMLVRLQDMALLGLLFCAVLSAIVLGTAIASALLAGGWVSSVKPVLPDFSRLNPLTGLGRLFTKDKFAEMVKLVCITLFMLGIAALLFSAGLPSITTLARQPSAAAIHALGQWLASGIAYLLLVLLVVGLIDLPWQRFLHRSRLKMSMQELKQELKESDGNPALKSRRRALQIERANVNSLLLLDQADFVLVNPSHYAVAIRYDDKTMAVPQLIAKGADLLALKLRELAQRKEIPVLESPVLARALYAHVELGQEIPAALYAAVAQVLAYVYRLKSALRGEGPLPGAVPQPQVPAGLDPHSLTAQLGPPP